MGRRGHRAGHGQRVRAPAALVAARRSIASSAPTSPERARHRIETDDAQVTVVDLHNLPDRAQRFVVGVTLRRAFERKEKTGLGQAAAVRRARRAEQVRAARGRSPIKELLLDIAERGRSLGIMLIGAQQTASEVERRIIANSAIRVVGRLDPAEATRPEYGFLPPRTRSGRRSPSPARCS